ncbi:MAG: hypothetical protein QM635_04285 [Microbacteriaceae bacterium]
MLRTIVFRGLHHVDHDWEQNRRAQDQATQWRADGAIAEFRELKYSYRFGADGQPTLDINGKKVPIGRQKEKGIDVLCAIAALREAEKPDVDLVVLATRDTDLVPVPDELHDRRGADPVRNARIETVSWLNKNWKAEGTKSGGPPERRAVRHGPRIAANAARFLPQ